MFAQYLITGATGFLGRTVLAQLRGTQAEIRALVMDGDPLARELPQNVRVVTGDVCDEAALERFFAGANENACVIHCAGLISVATHPGDRIYRVNVDGTKNMLKRCREHGVGRLVYVSSVHAIPEKPKGTEIAETTTFSPELVLSLIHIYTAIPDEYLGAWYGVSMEIEGASYPLADMGMDLTITLGADGTAEMSMNGEGELIQCSICLLYTSRCV